TGHVNRRAGRVEPTGELQDRSVLHREVTVRSGDGEGELEVRIDGVRLRRDNRVVKDEFAARVHVERISLMRSVFGEVKADVDQREASARVDIDRAVEDRKSVV